jgi:uncharacterized membrane protein
MKKIFLSLVSFMPVVTFAAGLEGILDKIADLLNKALPILISFAVVYFAWKVIQYTISDGDKREDAKWGIFYGVIGLFAIVAVWGLVMFVSESLGVDIGGTIDLPTLPTE